MRSADAKTPGPILVVSNLKQDFLLVHHAAAQARKTGARVILVRVIPPDPTEKKTSPGIVRITDPSACREVLDKLEFAALRLMWQGIICDPVVLSGDPVEQIVAIAHARGADRVLVASETTAGRSASGESSTAERLLGALEIPLFVFGPQVSLLPATDVSDGRILLPLSLRHDRPDYVKFASGLARETCSRLALLHVVNSSGMAEHQRTQLQTSARTQLAAVAASEPSPLFPIDILVREGDVVQSIVEETICPHRDLIVLGTGALHHGGPSRNGVVDQVIANARCPVVAIKPFRHSEKDSKQLPKAMTAAAD